MDKACNVYPASPAAMLEDRGLDRFFPDKQGLATNGIF